MSHKRTFLKLNAKMSTKRSSFGKLLFAVFVTFVLWLTFVHVFPRQKSQATIKRLISAADFESIMKTPAKTGPSVIANWASESDEYSEDTPYINTSSTHPDIKTPKTDRLPDKSDSGSLKFLRESLKFSKESKDDNLSLGKGVIKEYDLVCESPDFKYFQSKGDVLEENKRVQPLELKVLVFLTMLLYPTREGKNGILDFLMQLRIPFHMTKVSNPLPILEWEKTKSFSLIIFENYVAYLTMSLDKRIILDNYCQRFSIHVLAFMEPNSSSELQNFAAIGLKIQSGARLKQFKLNPESDIWHTANPDVIYEDALPTFNWTVFHPVFDTFKPLAFSTIVPYSRGTGGDRSGSEFGSIVAIHDVGKICYRSHVSI